MSKIICDVCGTSYPETATQCPICGCVRSSDSVTVAGDTSDVVAKNTAAYTPVKGGRFSKSNVKKRNSGKPVYEAEVQQKSNTVEGSTAGARRVQPAAEKRMPPIGEKKETSVKSNPTPAKSTPAPAKPARVKNKAGSKWAEAGLVVAIVILLLAIAGVVIYLACKYLLVDVNILEPNKPGTTQQVQDNTPSEDPETPALPCTKLTVTPEQVPLNSVGAEVLLAVAAEPAGQNYKFNFKSNDETVATVDDNGKVVAVGKGITEIVVSCGEVKAECKIICNFEMVTDPTETPTEPTEPEVKYKQKDLTLYTEDATFPISEKTFDLYTGEIPAELVQFKSNDESVATVDENGVVTFVSTGRAIITATYGDWSVECIVRVKN